MEGGSILLLRLPSDSAWSAIWDESSGSYSGLLEGGSQAHIYTELFDQSVPGGSFSALFFDSKQLDSNEFDNPFTYSFSSSGILHEGDLVLFRQAIVISTNRFLE